MLVIVIVFRNRVHLDFVGWGTGQPWAEVVPAALGQQLIACAENRECLLWP
jgi:hypothetical protein